MSKVIVIINPKGGAGKTTTAVHLANTLTQYGSVQLKDADPQASATSWVDIAEGNQDLPFHFEITNKTMMVRNKDNYDFTIIDTPPHDSSIIDAAVKSADFIIIPTAPSGLDLERVFGITELVSANKYAVLFTKADVRTKTFKLAREVLKEENIRMFNNIIPFRESIKRSFGSLELEPHYTEFTNELLAWIDKGDECISKLINEDRQEMEVHYE